MSKALKIILILAALTLIVLFLLPGFATFFTNIWWWSSEGYFSVYVKTLFIKAISFILPFILGLGLMNFWIFGLRKVQSNKILSTFILLFSIAGGVWGVLNWQLFVWNIGFPSTQMQDPIFGMDAYFYMFRLPLLDKILYLFQFYFAFLLLSDIIIHKKRQKNIIIEGRLTFDKPILALVIINTLISMTLVFFRLFETLVRQPHPKLGVDFTTVHGYFLGYYIYLGILFITVVWLILHTLRKGTRPLTVLICGAMLTAVFFLSTRLYPRILEKTKVSPNELFVQKDFINHRMDATRAGFDLRLEDYAFSHDLTNDLPEIFSKARIWDAEPYLKVVKQRQEIKAYFKFIDTDVDTYRIADQVYQVLLSARELNTSSLPPDTLTWDNLTLRYTHGYGVALSPAHTVEDIGGPEFWIKNLELNTPFPELAIKTPQIYFGELTSNYVIVRTTTEEFEYTANTNRVTTTYNAERGIRIQNFFRRLMLSLHFKESKILFTKYLTRDSRVLMRRNIIERVNTLFPYLKYDTDPYITIVEGRLFWIIDAYTVSDRFPIAQRFETPLGNINYLRNSVKVIVDAYTGQTDYIIVDDTDPICQAYKFIFPELFSHDIAPALKQHFRYPATLFSIQSEILATYHVDNQDSFYNGEDAWKIPEQIYGETRHPFRPYYLLSKINGKYQFSLITPYNPVGKENLAAWMIAYYDEGHHLALKYVEKTSSSFGPLQIESTIDQDETMSRLFSLWNQQGSKVFRGNIQFIPLNNDILYLESIFLESEQTSIPQLTRIIAVINGRVFQGRDFRELLMSIGGKYNTAWGDNASGQDKLIRQLTQAYKIFLEAEAQRVDGNLNAYQEKVDKIGEVLKNSLP